MTKEEFNKKVAELQQTMKVPKNNLNKFGGYNFRNAEDILEECKKHLGELVLELTEDMIAVGTQVQKKVTSTLISPCGEHRQSSSAFARESEEPPKGMSYSQNSGSAASYGLKYSLGRLFLLDDTKDDDSTNKHGKEEPKESPLVKKKQGSETPASEPVKTDESTKESRSFKRSFKRS